MTFAELEATWVQAAQNDGASSLAALAPVMAWIALGESSGDPSAYNANDTNGAGGTQTSAGLWQISNGTSVPIADWSDPLTNAEAAVQKLQTQGFGAWGLSGLDTCDLSSAFATIDARYSGRVSAALGGSGVANATATAKAALASASEWSPTVQKAVVVPVVLGVGVLLWGALKTS